MVLLQVVQVFFLFIIPVAGKYEWGPWGSFTNCTKTCSEDAINCRTSCGFGTKQRTRYLNNFKLTESKTENIGCFLGLCPVDGGWTMWNGWSACSKICGTGGIEIRRRFCISPSPSNDGKDCEGIDKEERLCLEITPCPDLPVNFHISLCTKEDFMCKSKLHCVPTGERCNGILKCHDGSDEIGCSRNNRGSNALISVTHTGILNLIFAVLSADFFFWSIV